MNRRHAIRNAVLLAFGAASCKFDVLHAATKGGSLTCNLNQFASLVFTYNGKTCTIPMGEVFASLTEHPHE